MSEKGTLKWAEALHKWAGDKRDELVNLLNPDKQGIVKSEAFVAALKKKGSPVSKEKLWRVVFAHDPNDDGWINVNQFFRGQRYLTNMPERKKPQPIFVMAPDSIIRRKDGSPYYMVNSEQPIKKQKRFYRGYVPRHPFAEDSKWYRDKTTKQYVNINYIVRRGEIDLLEKAFNNNTPVDIKDNYYKTPLIEACSSGQYEVAKYLLAKGADIHATDAFLWTPLHHACFKGRGDIVKLLVQAGANVNAQSVSNTTPLMNVIACGRPVCAEILLEAEANVHAETIRKKKTLDIAELYRDSTIANLIQKQITRLESRKRLVPKKGAKSGKVVPSLPSPVKNKVNVI